MTPLRRHRVDLTLAALALILVVVVLVDRGSVTTHEAEDRKHQLLDAWRPSDVRKLDIQIGDRTVVLESLEDADGTHSWQMREDQRQVDVDEQAVEQLLVSLEYATFDRQVEGLDEAAMGLTAPRVVIEVGMDRLHYQLRLGAEAPSPPGGAYVAVRGGARGTAYYAVGKELVDELLVRPDELRSRMLAVHLSPLVQSFTLSSTTRRFELTRGGWGGRTAGAFLLQAGDPIGKVRADRSAVDAWLASLGRLQAESFRSLPATDLDEPIRLTITPRDTKQPLVELSFGGPCEDEGQRLVVRTAPDPVAACVDAEVVERLGADPAELVDRHVVGTAEGDIMELRIDGPGATIDLARKEAGWHMRSPREGDADSGAVKQLLDQLLAADGEILAAAEAGDRGALGLDPPLGELRLLGLPERAVAGDPEERVERIAVGRPVGEQIYVERKDDGVILRLPRALERALLPDATVLRSSSVYELDLRRFRELRLDCAGRRQRLERDPAGGWTSLEPAVAGLGADMGMANDFCGGLRQLSAVRWVSAEAQGDQGLDVPWCVIAAKVDEVSETGDKTSRELRLELGAETQGGYFARHDDDPAVFIAPRAVAAGARYWMLDRAAILLPLQRIETLALSGRGDRRLLLTRRGDLWVPDSGPPSLGEVVRKALEALVAEGVTRLGAPDPSEGFDEPLLRIEVGLEGGEQARLTVGKGDVWRDTSIFYLRRDGIEATFAVAQARLQPLLDAL